MQQLLTGKARLPGFSGEWEAKRLGELGRFRGGTGLPTAVRGVTSGDYPFFKVSDMNNDGNETFMRFIHFVLLNTTLGDLVSTTALPSLSNSILSSIDCLLPPVDEQTAIATVLSDMDAEITALEVRRDKTRQIKQGMMQQLLTGRVRLVKPGAAA